MGSQLTFGLFALIVVVAALRVVTSRDTVRAGLALAVVLLGMAPLFLLMTAEFLAVVQILVYVGAVVVLVLFGIMLTKGSQHGEQPAGPRGARKVLAGVAVALLFGVLWLSIRNAFGPEALVVRHVGDTAGVGVSLLRDHIVEFEAVSVLLLAAFIGATVLARHDD